MKIQLNYDPATGQITDNTGAFIFNWLGLENHEVQNEAVSLQHGLEYKQFAAVSDLIKLKEAGFTADEIISMQARGVI